MMGNEMSEWIKFEDVQNKAILEGLYMRATILKTPKTKNKLYNA